MPPTRWLQADEDEADVLESAIDLFSLLSFVLIASTLLLGAAETARGRPNAARLSFSGFASDAVVPAIPSGTVVLIVDGKGNESSVEYRDSYDVDEKPLWTGSSSALASLENALSKNGARLRKAEAIALTLRNPDDADASLRLRVFYRIQSWLGKEQLDATVVLQ